MAQSQKIAEEKYIPMTREGYEELKGELIFLRTERRSEVARKLEEARGFGDLSENAEYHAAKEEQAQVEARIHWLDSRLSKAKVLDVTSMDTSKVALGTTVTFMDLERETEFSYTIVSSEESDPKKNRVSASSPVGQALLGKESGDEIQVRVPKGTRSLKILNISVKS
ncbi:MAG TPA: transcription elongation factor GreA [Synergistaceae bacterium]|nr:transcription elongation factor GreA [Synergistaceae bacterium]HPJ24923.1 transcription elongation factor GreA [Synergistaceae bacterium]